MRTMTSTSIAAPDSRPRILVKHCFSPSNLAPSEARRETKAAMVAWKLCAADVDRAELLVSELITNAVKFSHSEGAPSEIWLEIMNLPGRLTIAVFDGSSSPPRVIRHGPESEGGRGLALIEALSDEWGWAPVPGGGKVVCCAIRTATIFGGEEAIGR